MVMKKFSKPNATNRWKPIKRGAIYCSPACGGKCSVATFNKATFDAKALAKKMGPEWVPEVWENLGWHWSVEFGRASVRKSRDKTYICYFNGSKQFMCEAQTPKAAFSGAVMMLRTFIGDLTRDLKAIEAGK